MEKKNKQTAFAVVGVSDKGMVFALSAENREQGSARKQALPARLLMEGVGGGEQEGGGEGEQ